MKRRLFVFASALTIVLTAVVLAGCGSTALKLENAATYSPSEVQVGDWKFTLKGANVVFDESNMADDLVVYVDATNTSDGARAVSSTLNLTAYQHDENLGFGAATKEDGSVLTDYTHMSEDVQPGKTVQFVDAFLLKDYSDVRVTFGGFTNGIEPKDVTFKVDGLQTAKARDFAAGQASVRDTKEINLSGVNVKVADGWHPEEITDISCNLKKDDVGSTTGMTMAINCSGAYGSAEQWANTFRGNYAGASEITTVQVGSTTYYRFDPAPDQFQLFADSPAGTAVNIYGSGGSYDLAVAQLEKITLN